MLDTTNDMLPAYGVRLFAGKMLLELDNDDSSVCKWAERREEMNGTDV